MLLAAHPLSPLSIVLIVIVVVAALFVTQWARRRRADQAAGRLGGAVVTGPLPTPHQQWAPPPGNIGAPNPALPPALAPDQRTGVVTSGPPIELSVCGLPALVWQRTEHTENQWQPMRLSLIADTAVGLPILHLYHRSGVLGALGDRFAEAQSPSGVPALDEAFRFSGDLRAWGPVLAAPAVTRALLTFPLASLSVLGGRFTLVSRDGVHLDPSTTSAIAQVVVALVQAVPPQLTAGASALPPGALHDPEAVVQSVLARSGLTAEQQQAMLALVRASRQR